MAQNNQLNSPEPFAITAGGTAVASVTTSPTASAWSGWDANKNASANSFISSYTTTATAAGTTTLTVSSTWQQFFTGSTTQTVTLPVTSTLVLGQSFYIVNNSSGNVTVNSSGGNAVQVMGASTTLLVTCILTSGTTAASWATEYVGAASGGTVSSGTINQLAYYAATGTTVSGLATANNGVFVTSNTGVPSWNTSLGQGLSVASSVLSVGGANNIPFNTGKGFQDNNGNSLILFTVAASAVNYIGVFNEPTGTGPFIVAQGTDTNMALGLQGKGTGGVNVYGTATNDNAPASVVGQFISSTISSGSAVTATSGTATNLTSISLTAGDWDVWGNVCWPTLGTTPTNLFAWISTTSATLPDASLRVGYNISGTFAQNSGVCVVPVRISISATTTVYITGFLGNVSGNGTQCGGIFARRVR